jgi:nitrous oxidase accessory protein
MRYALAIVLLLAMVGAAQGATTWTVGPGRDYATITLAINAGTTGNGDIILVYPGTYNESITINKKLTVKSSGGAAVTILNGNSVGENYYMVTIKADDVTFDGFTVTNPIYNSTADASGVLIGSEGRNSNIRVLNCVIHDMGTATRSPASFGTFGINCGPVNGLEVSDCEIYNIKNGDAGPDVYAIGILTWGNSSSETADKLTIWNNSIHDIVNPGTGARGIAIGGDSANVQVSNNTIYGSFRDGITTSSILDGPITITNNTVTGGTASAILLRSTYAQTVTGNTLRACGTGIIVDTTVTIAPTIKYNSIAGNTAGLNNLATVTVTAVNNWWGSATGPGTVGPGTGDTVSTNVDYNPWLTTPAIHTVFGGRRLAEKQYTDGAWGWPLDAPPTYGNTIGPIAMGLAKAYRATGDPAMLTALGKAATYLQSKIVFSPSDGYLAAELDSVLGGSTNVTYVKTNFYDKLVAGTYRGSGGSGPFTTASYVAAVRAGRTGNSANLAAWDVGMGLVGAKACGASTAEWIAGTEAEVNELNGANYYDVIGLAGALYGLKTAGVDFDPSAGEHSAADNLADLAAILAGYQILPSGGFSWNMYWVIPNDGDEAVQETAYAMLALDAMGGYSTQVAEAAQYLMGVQLTTGGMKNYTYVGSTSTENNEVSAEGYWGLSLANKLYLDVPDASLYVRRGETNVLVTLNQTAITEPVAGYQAFLSFSTARFAIVVGDITLTSTPFGLPVTSSVGTGTIDLAAGIGPSQSPTTEAAKLADLYFDVSGTAPDGPTQITFRANDPPTRYTDIDGYEVTAATEDSPVIIIDGTLPAVTVTSPDGGEYLKGGGSWTVTWTATDDNMAPNPIKIEYTPDNGANWVTIATGEANDGTYTWSPVVSLNTALAKVRVTATDLAGNNGSDESNATFTIDSQKPTVTDISAKQGGGPELTPSGTAIKGVVNIAVATSDNLSGIPSQPTVTVKPYGASAEATTYAGRVDNTFNYTWSVTATTPNGQAEIKVTGLTDGAGNVGDDATDTFNINKSQLQVTIELEGVRVSIDRTIKFTFGGDGGAVAPVTVSRLVSFVSTGPTTNTKAVFTWEDIPNAGAWTKVSAKDEQHTLRQTVATSGTNQQYVVTFTGTDALTGGDATNDNWVDILDFGVFAGQYGTSPSLTTTWPTRNADISCGGGVGTEDFSYIQIHFLATGDPAPGYAVAAAGVPLSSITVKELAKIVGQRAAQKADVNNDRIVDAKDIALFIQKMDKPGR